MKFILSILIALTIASCNSADHVKSEIELLELKRDSLIAITTTIEKSIASKRSTIANLNEQIRGLGIKASGNQPIYILKLHLEQNRFSLKISDHVKDAMNAIDFEMRVDEQMYKSVNVGSVIVNDFRTGSFIMKGSFGNWKMSVKEKRFI